MTPAADHFRRLLDAATEVRSLVEASPGDTSARVQVALTTLLDAHRRAVAEAGREAASPEAVARFRRLYTASIPDFDQAPEAFLRRALAALADVLQADPAAFVVLDAEGAPDRVIGHTADGHAPDHDDLLGVSAGVLRRVRATRGALAIPDLSGDELYAARHSIVQSGTRSVMCVPVLAGGDVWGAAYVARRSGGAPFGRDDLAVLTAFVQQTGAALQTFDRLERLRDASAGRHRAGTRLIGHSRALDVLLEQVAAVADTDATVLITGESGTGKELLARTVHEHSRRASGPFVAVNCGAIPEALLESTLFGHKKGSFTGAVSDEAGLIASAAGGSLFLDEIGDMPLLLQVKLLRVLQTGAYTRVGDTAEQQADVRWIAATHRTLPDAIREGTFREDLYYRLAVFDLPMPPLRERIEDVSVLANHFIRRFAPRYDRPARQLSADALAALEAYPWPGNVRELENVIQRAVILAGGATIQRAHLTPTVAGSPPDAPAEAGYHDAVRAFKRRYLERALEAHDGSRTATAEALGLNRTYLSRLLRQLDLQDDD